MPSRKLEKGEAKLYLSSPAQPSSGAGIEGMGGIVSPLKPHVGTRVRSVRTPGAGGCKSAEPMGSPQCIPYHRTEPGICSGPTEGVKVTNGPSNEEDTLWSGDLH